MSQITLIFGQKVSKTAKVGKELVNTAQVTSATNDPNMANNTATQETMVTK